MSVFFLWLIGLYPFNFFPIKCAFNILVLLIVLSQIDSYLRHCYSLLEVLNQNLNLKFHQMEFWFEFLDIHMNEKAITCHDCHCFKWQNINIYPILIFFFAFQLSFWLIGLWLHLRTRTRMQAIGHVPARHNIVSLD